ncbi:sigma-70 family RNA polymerase sigma factor [Nocardioides humilatus]|uniref:Sigma-70 family RNA polymerase sigma factor n=1 Tax=Nocardioides humilatus TaxID=2607660 RepID=A0A5B1L8B8_9ACTN|nr:sigma-70 family RNA polymerase sigma factor [Nocardioides humilatus]KAA1415979.1 sigma-70 family RNA polymerase sigma factor [Nocardioides humilatus]
MSERTAPGREVGLLARIRVGDECALAAVYDDYAPLVYGVARRVTRDEQLARDVCQEVFTYLWEFPEKVDLTRGPLRAFLAMIAHRRAVDEVRRSERRSRAETSSVELDVADDANGPETDVVDSAAARWRDERLAAVLDLLPEDQCAALRLAYFDGLTYLQVATRLGIPEGTAKSRLRLALARLRTLLDPEFRAVI